MPDPPSHASLCSSAASNGMRAHLEGTVLFLLAIVTSLCRGGRGTLVLSIGWLVPQ